LIVVQVRDAAVKGDDGAEQANPAQFVHFGFEPLKISWVHAQH
jgi:hypothetical protein